MTLVMAYDFGTTSLKAAVVQHGGRIVADADVSYPVSQPEPGWAELAVEMLWDLAAATGRRALETAGLSGDDISTVVFVAPWKGIVPIGARGDVLHPAIIWMDGRATAEAREINERAGFFVGTGQEYWPRLAWLKRHRAKVWERSRLILGLTGYLRWRATGVASVEISDDFVTSGDGPVGDRRRAILAAADLDDDLGRFPAAVASTDIVGRLTLPAATELGLAPGTPVLGGFGDLSAITVGAAPVVDGAAHLYFGTSSWFAALLRPGETVEAPLTFQLAADREAVLFPLQTGCLAYDWIVEQVYGAEKAHLHEAIQELVNEQVAEIPPGSDDLLATHWLTGELPPLSKNAKGVFLNLTTRHDRRHMVRAVMESLCYSHRSSLERFEQQTGRRLDAVRVVGGGASSRVWMQMLADVLGRVVEVPERPRYTGVIGAQFCSVVALGEAADLSSVDRTEQSVTRFDPDPAAHEIYTRLHRIYTGIHPALADLFTELNGPA